MVAGAVGERAAQPCPAIGQDEHQLARAVGAEQEHRGRQGREGQAAEILQPRTGTVPDAEVAPAERHLAADDARDQAAEVGGALAGGG